MNDINESNEIDKLFELLDDEGKRVSIENMTAILDKEMGLIYE